MDFEKGYHVLPKWLSYNMIWSRVLTKAGRLIVLKKNVNTLSHALLLHKLARRNFDMPIVKWIQVYLSSRY